MDNPTDVIWEELVNHLKLESRKNAARRYLKCKVASMLQGSPYLTFNANEPTKDAYQDAYHFIIKPIQLTSTLQCIACHCLVVFYAKSAIELVEIPQNQPSISWSRAEILEQ